MSYYQRMLTTDELADLLAAMAHTLWTGPAWDPELDSAAWELADLAELLMGAA